MTGRRAAVGRAAPAVAALLAVLVSCRAAPEEAEVETDVAVHVAGLRRATVRRFVTAYGRVEPAPAAAGRAAATALITPFVDGVLAEVRAVEGQSVAAGTVLFRLDSRMAQVAVGRARQRAEFAESAFRRQETLLPADGTSRRAYLEARQQLDDALSELAAAETDLSYLSLATPLAGTVVQVSAEVGRHVDASTVLARVVDLDRVVVTAGVPVREIAGLAPGQAVLVGAGESEVAGVVTVLGRDVDPATGTYRVHASLPAGAGLLPGRFTEIRILVEEHADVLVAPEASVVAAPGGGAWIVVVEGDERAVRRPVVPGLREGGLVEIAGDGLAEGTRIVTDEAYSLPAETRVRVVSG